MSFTFELASDLEYFRGDFFCVHYFDDSLFEKLSLGVMQGLKGGSAHIHTPLFRCTTAFSIPDLCIW